MRQALSVNARRVAVAHGASIRAPVGGWDAVSAIADMPEDRAIVLDNWFPRPESVAMRSGSAIHSFAVPGSGNPPVETLMVYNGATISRMFAAFGGKAYDVSAAGAPPPAVFSGKSNDRWQWTNFTTIGGSFMMAVNGTDAPMLYDGTAWSNPTITGTDSHNFIHINAFKNRLWFVIKDSTTVAYLDTGAIQGPATTMELGGLLSRGGAINAMGTWTRDAGDGQDDIAVFISTRGEVVCFQGSDPDNANTWSLIGVFHLGAPIGRRCFEKVGGDLALINIDGVLPLSKALLVDRGAARTIAVTANIQNAMNEAARDFQFNFGWQLIVYPRGTMAILNVPISENNQQQQYVMNTLTGAWCRFIGQNAPCWALFRDNLYYGTNDGIVAKADTGNLDIDQSIEAVGQTAYQYFGSRGVLKRFDMIRPIITTDSSLQAAVGVSTDFRDNAFVGTPTAATFLTAKYESAIYDSDFYPVTDRVLSDWTALTGLGHCASIHFRTRSGPVNGVSFFDWDFNLWDTAVWSDFREGELLLRLNAFDLTYEIGGFI